MKLNQRHISQTHSSSKGASTAPHVDKKSILESYLVFLRGSNKETRYVHAFGISGLFTLLVAFLWLHFHYGFWNFSSVDVYDANTAYEERIISSSTLGGATDKKEGINAQPFSSFLKEVSHRFGAIQFTNYNVTTSVYDQDTYQNPDKK